MKKLPYVRFIMSHVVLLIILTGLCFADAKPTKEQELLLRIEKLINTRDYLSEQMQKLEAQYRNFRVVKIRADRELKILEAQLDKLKGKKEK